MILTYKRVKLQLWDTSGQGHFCTIIRSYSREAQGIILVYEWSFDGIDRWLKEVEEHAPGIPKVPTGIDCIHHLNGKLRSKHAELYATRNNHPYYGCRFTKTTVILHGSRRRPIGTSRGESVYSRFRKTTTVIRVKMLCFEISPLCDFNLRESFSEMNRMALHRNGMQRIWRTNKVLSLQNLFLSDHCPKDECLHNRGLTSATIRQIDCQVIRT